MIIFRFAQLIYTDSDPGHRFHPNNVTCLYASNVILCGKLGRIGGNLTSNGLLCADCILAVIVNRP